MPGYGALLFALLFLSQGVHAQTAPSKAPLKTIPVKTAPPPAPGAEPDEINVVEEELERNIPSETFEPQVAPTNAPAAPKVDLSDLGKPDHYAGVASIQLDYMPKYERWMLTAGFTLNPTDPFFTSAGFSAGATYFLNSFMGIQAQALKLFNYRNNNSKDLEDKQGTSVENLVTPTSLLWAGVEFYPIYGKGARDNREIIPFDVFFEVGGGRVTDQAGSGSTALGGGMGVLFSNGRSNCFKLNAKLITYRTKNVLGDEMDQQNLFINLSYGWLFPEPRYR